MGLYEFVSDRMWYPDPFKRRNTNLTRHGDGARTPSLHFAARGTRLASRESPRPIRGHRVL